MPLDLLIKIQHLPATQHGNVQIRSFVATLHIDMGCPGPIAAPLSMEVFLVSVEHGGTSEQWDCMGHTF
jgi:hypothetical protein